jgi:excinuclease ABC subunit C
MGAHAVGAMVVSGPDGFAKGEYRLYNVENTIGDDYAILREVLTTKDQETKRR